MSNPGQAHILFLALHSFAAKHNGQMPRVWNEDDAKELILLATEINSGLPASASAKLSEPIDQNLAKQLAFTARGSLVGLTAFLGGFVAQEALKALSGKFSPLKQWVRIK